MKPHYRTRYLERIPERVMRSGLSRLRTDHELIAIVRKGADWWNAWREEHWETDVRAQRPSLFKADLRSLSLQGINLFNADLQYANLSGSDLSLGNFQAADLSNANLRGAKMADSELRYASLVEADLKGADLSRSVLALANLSCASLENANISESIVFGAAAWNVKLDNALQTDLLVTRFDEPEITTDNLSLAQFLHLLLMNGNVRAAIDTITSKVVLILGRFTPERKAILDAIRDGLRKRDYLPVLFDFEKPANRDITETVSTLAHMARFVIADITDAKSIPQELMRIVPALPSVPVQPLLLASQREYSMFEHFKRFPWVLEPLVYEDQDGLLAVLTEKVIAPAETKAKQQIG